MSCKLRTGTSDGAVVAIVSPSFYAVYALFGIPARAEFRALFGPGYRGPCPVGLRVGARAGFVLRPGGADVIPDWMRRAITVSSPRARGSLAAAETPGTVAPEFPPGVRTTNCAEARPTR